MTCSIGDCGREGKLTRGMCAKHYRAWIDHTPPENSQKTHCIRGHELSGENLRIVGTDQRRQCRACDNERSRIKMAKRRARNAVTN